MYTSKRSGFRNVFSITLVIVSAAAVIINPASAQRGQTADNPFIVVFTIGPVDNSTGQIVSWVTSHNITRANFYNASQVDLQDAYPRDGFIDNPIVFPNGTMQLGDEYTACAVILKDAYMKCDKGFNAPTNRAEFANILIPSSLRK